MSNLRILYNNIFDNASAVVASTTASGSLSVDNLNTEIKSHVHRSTGTSVSFTIDWTTDQAINCVVIPCCNLSGTATIRVRLYNSISSLLYDSTVITAVPGFNLDLTGITHDANVFAYGFISKTAVWTSLQTTVRSCVIDIVDTSNSAGYIDTSRICIGKYWTPTYNMENGIQLQSIDNSIISRTNAGELVSDNGFIFDKVNFNFALLPETDRTEIAKIIRKVGTSNNFLLSMLPEYATSTAEHDFMIYGKRSNSALVYKVFDFYNHSMEVTSW